MRKRTIPFFFLLLIAVSVYPGDIAVFQNLGFSPDAKYFMFAQYGINEKKSTPYADFFIIHVAQNRFVPNGVKNVFSSKAVGAGNDGLGALFNLLEENIHLKKKYNVDHIRTGRLLYILLDGQKPDDELEFRDFQAGNKYTVKLNQSALGSGKEIKSSFHIIVTVEQSGSIKSYTVGLPNFWRKRVKSYQIKQILLGPDNKSLIFVVAKEEMDTTGSNIRYMVETLKL